MNRKVLGTIQVGAVAAVIGLYLVVGHTDNRPNWVAQVVGYQGDRILCTWAHTLTADNATAQTRVFTAPAWETDVQLGRSHVIGVGCGDLTTPTHVVTINLQRNGIQDGNATNDSGNGRAVAYHPAVLRGGN